MSQIRMDIQGVCTLTMGTNMTLRHTHNNTISHTIKMGTNRKDTMTRVTMTRDTMSKGTQTRGTQNKGMQTRMGTQTRMTRGGMTGLVSINYT